MKYTILGFSQKKLIELEISLDEALILRYFVDFKDSGKMAKEYLEDDMYYWIDYKTLTKELQILNISKDRVYRKLKHLVSMGILKHKTKKKGGTFSFYAIGSRYIELISNSVKITEGTVEITEGYGKNDEECTVKITEGYGENTGTKDSSIKYPSINNSSIKDIYTSVINYLNEKAGTKYRSTTKKTKELIKARINEGFTIENFYDVIDKKVKEWTGQVSKDGVPMENYLRPETLFGTKFEGYLNQKNSIKQSNAKVDSFNNYDQRSYDYDDLERKLLGWEE